MPKKLIIKPGSKHWLLCHNLERASCTAFALLLSLPVCGLRDLPPSTWSHSSIGEVGVSLLMAWAMHRGWYSWSCVNLLKGPWRHVYSLTPCPHSLIIVYSHHADKQSSDVWRSFSFLARILIYGPLGMGWEVRPRNRAWGDFFCWCTLPSRSITTGLVPAHKPSLKFWSSWFGAPDYLNRSRLIITR